jgi:uncharacterized protein YndB with AHSA1/START domain
MENNNNQYGSMTAVDTIRFERILPGPVERVWAYLTESEKRGKWLATGEMELFEGGQVTLHFFHNDLSPLPGTIPDKYKSMEKGATLNGKILQCQPPHLLAFTWGDGSEVSFELSALGDKVKLVVTHSKLKEAKEGRMSVAGGWHTHLGILIANLEGTVPGNFWQTHAALEKEYAALL